jgi:AraC-like DNA-binding protein
MKRILNEDMVRGAFYQQQINGMVKQLLIEMIRIRNTPEQDAALPPVMMQIFQYVEDNIAELHSVAQIAQAFSYHPVYINSLFKRYSGQTAHAFITQKKIDSVEKTLRFTDMSITEVAQAYSFSDCSHLSRVFKKVKGFSPAEIRREANEKSMLSDNRMD